MAVKMLMNLTQKNAQRFVILWASLMGFTLKAEEKCYINCSL